MDESRKRECTDNYTDEGGIVPTAATGTTTKDPPGEKTETKSFIWTSAAENNNVALTSHPNVKDARKRHYETRSRRKGTQNETKATAMEIKPHANPGIHRGLHRTQEELAAKRQARDSHATATYIPQQDDAAAILAKRGLHRWSEKTRRHQGAHPTFASNSRLEANRSNAAELVVRETTTCPAPCHAPATKATTDHGPVRGLRRTRQELEAKRQHARNVHTLPRSFPEGPYIEVDFLATQAEQICILGSAASGAPAVLSEDPGYRRDHDSPDDLQLDGPTPGGLDSAAGTMASQEDALAPAQETGVADTVPEPGPPNVPQTTNSAPSASDEEHLAQAHPVMDLEIGRAKAVDPKILEEAEVKRQKARECRRVGYVLLAISLSIIVISVTVSQVRTCCGPTPVPTPNGTNVSTPTPTSNWTNISTPAPTVFIQDLPSYTLSALTDPFSPQSLAYKRLLDYPNFTSQEEWKKRQLFGLTTFFYSLDGVSWPRPIQGDWFREDKDECDWFSMSYVDLEEAFNIYAPYQFGRLSGESGDDISICDDLGHYTSLGLVAAQGMQGKVPQEIEMLPSLRDFKIWGSNLSISVSDLIPPAMANLSNLTWISFNNNKIHGTLPSWLWGLSKLEDIDFTLNEVSGPLPSDFGRLSRLQTINLGYNSLTGSLPSEIGLLTELKEGIALDHNQLMKSIPSQLGRLNQVDTILLNSNILTSQIPTELWTSENLKHLFLSSNQLQGPLIFGNQTSSSSFPIGCRSCFDHERPSSLAPLEELYLNENFLSSSIPPEIGWFTGLKELYLYENNISGTLPVEMKFLTSLYQLSLFDNSLHGPFPSVLGELTALKELYLSENYLSSTLPSELGHLTALKLMSLDYNQLTGTIFTNLGQMSALETLYLDGNTFTGTVPSQIGSLTSLDQLFINENGLNGSLPTEIGALEVLREFVANSNPALTGQVPSEIGNMQNMMSFLVHSTQLSGSLPTQLGRASLMEFLFLAYNLIQGPIPSEIGLLTDMRLLYLDGNLLSSSIPSEIGSLRVLDQLTLPGNALTGSLPTEIWSIESMTWLDTIGNNLQGTLPSSLIGKLQALQVLDLGENEFEGSIPSQLGQLESLVWVSMNRNQLTGRLETELGQLSQLHVLDISENPHLLGTVPSELGLTALTSLRIHGTSLSGILPSELCALSALTVDANCSKVFCGDCNCSCVSGALPTKAANSGVGFSKGHHKNIFQRGQGGRRDAAGV